MLGDWGCERPTLSAGRARRGPWPGGVLVRYVVFDQNSVGLFFNRERSRWCEGSILLLAKGLRAAQQILLAAAQSMDGTDQDVLERMRENAGAFEVQANKADERLNDGNNYRGLMSVDDYKAKRTEILEDTAEKRAKEKADKLQTALDTNRADAVKAEREREERERQRKEKLKRELEGSSEGGGGSSSVGGDEEGQKKKKKKKKKDSESMGLSFDAEEEG